MRKQWLVLISCISFCGCTSLQPFSTAGVAAEPGDLSQPTVTQVSTPSGDEQSAARAADSPALAQDAVEPRSFGWVLLGIAGVILFFYLLERAAAAALCC
jgi:hypothetical protein